MIRDNTTLYVANVGDSSVVLGQLAANGCSVKAKMLTVVCFDFLNMFLRHLVQHFSLHTVSTKCLCLL